MKKIVFICAAMSALVAASCSKTEVNEQEKGFGMLSVDMNLPQQTRSISEEDLYATAQVNIYKEDFSGLVRSYTYGQIPSPLYLAVDKYRVDVIAGEAVSAEPAAASWENKSYKGSEIFDIVAGQLTNVKVVASVNNAVTNIAFDQTVTDNFEAGYTFTVGLDPQNPASQLVYDASKSGSEGYFIVDGIDEPSFTWTFAGNLAKDGSAFSKTGTIKDIEPGKMYKLNLQYIVKDGDVEFTITVDRTTDICDDTIIFEPISTGLSASSVYEIWAGHATVHADVDAEEFAGAQVQFAYASAGSDWTTVEGEDAGEGSWKAVLTGLAPSTEYSYKLIVNGEQQGEALTFTTASAPKIPNGSFEYASFVTGADYYKFYDPNCGVEEGSFKFWGSGNGDEDALGSADYKVITTIDTNEKVHGNQSVLAQSQWAVIKFAAGNIFTGSFAGLVGTEGGKVNFGRPWTARPTALKLYCKFTTGAINRVSKIPAGEDIVQGETMDEAEIRFAIGNWTQRIYGGTAQSPVQVNTTDESTFIDYNTDPSTIAYGNLILHHDGYELNGAQKVTSATNEWKEYIIPLDYKTTTAFPTHIIISVASSRFGDYFTGCDYSKLWVDAVELIYE